MSSVLIIDDEPNIRRMVGALLASEGYEVRDAAEGAAGLARVSESCPDAVLLDLMMPGELDGLATPVGPASTLAAVALVNELKVRTAELLVERGAMTPVLTSAAVVGADESKRLFDSAYAEHARRVARALRGTDAR